MIYTISFSGIAILVDWLIQSQIPPFNYVLLNNAWAILNTIPHKLGGLTSQQPIHSIILLLKILQWAILGYLISIPISKIMVKNPKKL